MILIYILKHSRVNIRIVIYSTGMCMCMNSVVLFSLHVCCVCFDHTLIQMECDTSPSRGDVVTWHAMHEIITFNDISSGCCRREKTMTCRITYNVTSFLSASFSVQHVCVLTGSVSVFVCGLMSHCVCLCFQRSRIMTHLTMPLTPTVVS